MRINTISHVFGKELRKQLAAFGGETDFQEYAAEFGQHCVVWDAHGNPPAKASGVLCPASCGKFFT